MERRGTSLPATSLPSHKGSKGPSARLLRPYTAHGRTTVARLNQSNQKERSTSTCRSPAWPKSNTQDTMAHLPDEAPHIGISLSIRDPRDLIAHDPKLSCSSCCCCCSRRTHPLSPRPPSHRHQTTGIPRTALRWRWWGRQQLASEAQRLAEKEGVRDRDRQRGANRVGAAGPNA